MFSLDSEQRCVQPVEYKDRENMSEQTQQPQGRAHTSVHTRPFKRHTQDTGGRGRERGGEPTQKKKSASSLKVPVQSAGA